jgi:hypothetical protein
MSDDVPITMSRRHAAITVAACLHLALVVCGAAKVKLPSARRPGGLALATYRAYTGSDNAYGFFAPGVASEWRGHFEVCRANGRCFEADLPRGNPEAAVLLSSIHGMLAYDVRDVLAASLAAAEFARVSDARTILVKVQVYAVPTMAQFRAGQRPRWRTAYAYAFTRIGRAS